MEQEHFTQQFTVRWSDVDPNRHLRGTVYMDYADHTRFAYLQHMGITNEKMKELQIGPVIFHVSATYKKEVHLLERVIVNCKLDYLLDDGKKWGILHEVFNQKGEIACIVKAEGAWLDLKQRKVVSPPSIFTDALAAMSIQSKGGENRP